MFNKILLKNKVYKTDSLKDTKQNRVNTILFLNANGFVSDKHTQALLTIESARNNDHYNTWRGSLKYNPANNKSIVANRTFVILGRNNSYKVMKNLGLHWNGFTFVE